jgi:hypothetical protein
LTVAIKGNASFKSVTAKAIVKITK